MYCTKNVKTKAELKRAVAAGEQLGVYSPGLGVPPINGETSLEGPWYPKPHSWYARVTVRDGVIVKVK